MVEGAKPYWKYHDEISCQDGILLKGTRVIIPTTMHAARDATYYPQLTPRH